MAIRIKNGTPVFGESLCDRCSKSHIERGFRETEKVVYCEATCYAHLVPFPVRDCSDYVEKRRQTLTQMEEIAWILSPRGSKRQAGFVSASDRHAGQEAIELILRDGPSKQG
jgi:hypothetical protein